MISYAWTLPSRLQENRVVGFENFRAVTVASWLVKVVRLKPDDFYQRYT
jgi:hypothetical protein